MIGEPRGAYISIPDTLDIEARSATTRYIIVVEGDTNYPFARLQASAVRTALDLGDFMRTLTEAPAPSAPVEMDAEPFWKVPEQNGTWLQIDITERLRAAGPDNPFHGVFLHKRFGYIYAGVNGTSSGESDGAEDAYPRLLIIDNE